MLSSSHMMLSIGYQTVLTLIVNIASKLQFSYENQLQDTPPSFALSSVTEKMKITGFSDLRIRRNRRQAI